MFANRGLDLNNVIEIIGNNQESAKLLYEKLSDLRYQGTLQETENGDQFYVFNNQSFPGTPETPVTMVMATCMQDLLKLSLHVLLKVEYASKMWTSRGKLDESAFYTFLFRDPGNMWLCQSVKENKTSQNPPFSGQYCYSTTIDGFFGLGFCVPDTCSETDLNILFWLLLLIDGSETFAYIDCTEPTPWSAADIGFTACLAFFAFMVLCGSLYDLFLQQKVLRKMCHHTEEMVDNNGMQEKSKSATENDYENIRNNKIKDDQGSDIATTSVDSALDATLDVSDGVDGESMEGAKVNEGYDFGEEKDVEDAVKEKSPALEVKMENTSSFSQIHKRSRITGWAVLHAVMMSFSAINNCNKLLSAKKRNNNLGVLNGLRVLSMFWVILGHSAAFYIGRLHNPMETFEITASLGFLAIINSSVSVDTFFVLSGFLVTYLTLRQIDSVRKRSTTQWAGFWSLFYFHRWWRLTPVYMATMGIFALLKPHFGLGWSTDFFSEYIKDACRRLWWTHPLYINNLYPWPNDMDESCMGWSWYLANDMQFFIISPFIIIVLYKNGKAGLCLVASVMMVSLSSLFGINWYYGFTINAQERYTDNVPEPGNEDVIYPKPYTRIPPYLVGMIVAYAIFKLKGKQLKVNPPVMLAGWAVALTILWLVLYGIWFPNQRTDVPQSTAVMYLTFFRVAWGAGIGWIIFACILNYGGPIGSILSWKVWIPLARLTYCAYLVHPIIIFTKVHSDAFLFHMSYITLSYLFVANLVLSYVSALILSLLIEGPTMGLEKVMFGKFKRS
ncbi:nose resistant to fluoxetine protein 6-like [Lytechinus variegatus]|uniref:nose resistant to fluoxetine protein 6-like n=1 Tax=Lytechinus variegatus TaxID=7654 RepID=UPI001BB2D038|nr:nose resistant to fluoxetine protein 6-like [Lytechinus variegatus]